MEGAPIHMSDACLLVEALRGALEKHVASAAECLFLGSVGHQLELHEDRQQLNEFTLDSLRR